MAEDGTRSDAASRTAADGGRDRGDGRRDRGDGGPDRVEGGPDRVDVALDVADRSDWTVSPGVFGKFTEMNGREGYPGIYSDHVANGSFEEWHTWPKRTPPGNPPWWRRSEVIFRDVDPSPGVAYPWEPVLPERASATFEHAVGGVHGRGETGRDRTDVHGRTYREPEARYQRVTVWEGRAGVAQRVALPDRRTREFVLYVSVRGGGHSSCAVRLEDPSGETLARQPLPVTDEWERHEVGLSLDAESSERYRGSPFGTLTLAFDVEGRGHVDLDWVMLRAGDAVAGTFNPTTIENLREYDVPNVRWPGGNFTSQYHWRDGVGPLADRPVRSELHWGGLEPNYLGTNEFLEFCEHAGVEPYLNPGFSHEITPGEVADWVEYVNGDPDETDMGALRAEHGYEEPWDVEVWQVGNEVWGSFQIGHTDGADYGRRFVDYHEAMTAVDPDIEVCAVGLDPGMETHGGAAWNDALFEAAADRVEGVDLHRYVHGESPEGDVDPLEFNRQLVCFPSQFEANIREVRETAARHGVEDLWLTVGEWNMGARALEEGERAEYGSQGHAAFCAGMYNAFVRQGDAVRFCHQRDNAFKHRPFPEDLRPIHTANNRALRLYTEVVAGDRDWHHVPATVDGPTGHIDRHGVDIEPMDDVPLVDVAAVTAADGSATHLYATNRDLREPHEVRVVVGGSSDPATPDRAEVTVQSADDPLDTRTDWDGGAASDVETRALTVDEEGVVAFDLPPAGVARLDLEVEGGPPADR